MTSTSSPPISNPPPRPTIPIADGADHAPSANLAITTPVPICPVMRNPALTIVSKATPCAFSNKSSDRPQHPSRHERNYPNTARHVYRCLSHVKVDGRGHASSFRSIPVLAWCLLVECRWDRADAICRTMWIQIVTISSQSLYIHIQQITWPLNQPIKLTWYLFGQSGGSESRQLHPTTAWLFHERLRWTTSSPKLMHCDSRCACTCRAVQLDW